MSWTNQTRRYLPATAGTLVLLLVIAAAVMPATAGMLHSAAIAAGTSPRSAEADSVPSRSARTVTLDIDELGDEPLAIEMGRSKLIDMPRPVTRVTVTRPEVADVQILSPTQILVMGLSVGLTDLIIWDEDDRATRIDIEVSVDLEFLNDQLRALFPDSTLAAMQSRDMLAITGSLRRAEDAATLKKFLESTGITHVDMTRVEGVQQVLLQVRVAEVSRNALRALDVNAFHGSRHFFGSLQTGGFNPVNMGAPEGASALGNIPFQFIDDASVTNAATLFMGFPRADLQVFLQALAENQYLRILAEPNLVALSGEDASFLAGGEFPVPIVQGTGGTSQSITIEYREFGVRLSFRPVVLGDNTIRLKVAPEVSDLSDIGAVEIEGFRIPGVLTRRAETTLELKSGQSFAMAGLMNQRSQGRTSKIPLLGDLPVLGPLFRSVRYERGETELVVMVTASLVDPLSVATAPPLPGDLHIEPDDWELFAKGQLEGEAPPKLAPADQKHLRRLGLDRLMGPGAWVGYATPPAVPQPDPEPEPEEEEAQEPEDGPQGEAEIAE